MKLVGREKEIKTLKEEMESQNSVFLAVYGRRRVGKTFLLRQTLSDRIVFLLLRKSKCNKTEPTKVF